MENNYVNGYLNYTGGKFKLLNILLPEFDYDKPYFIDLFTGSFVVGANVLDKYQKVLSNDIIKELVQIHQELLLSDDIIEKTKNLCPHKDDAVAYGILRDSFNKNKTPEGLWALILCCNSNLMRFNKQFAFNQTHGKRSWNSSTDIKVEAFKNLIRPYKDKIYFSNKHFSDVKITKPSMVYCDPPYSNTEAGYNCYWDKSDDIKLYEYCKNLDRTGSSFVVSGVLSHGGKSCLLLDKLISDGFKYKELLFDYNKISKTGEKNTIEIIVKNF
jgi:DNA adenine methylase Dam